MMNPATALERQFEKIPTTIHQDAGTASLEIAKTIRRLIEEKQQSGKNCILGLATGSSPIRVYDELVRMHQEEGLSFNNVITFNLDEYYPMEPDKLQSYVRFMNEYLFDHVDIDKNNVHVPDGTTPIEKISDYCTHYEQMIQDAGGIDLQLLGIGRTGHIGFNEPGSREASRTRLINLDKTTRIAAASDFFGEEFVPRRAITMGVKSILESRQVILMAWGEGKASVIQKAVEGPITDQIPATFLQNHPQSAIIIDEGAAAELTRVKTPWLVGPCDWDKQLTRKAVVWLCGRVDKPILKLTPEDYNENGMSDLIADHGPAYDINIRVFNELQHTITGWPGGKPNADDSQRPERAQPYPKRVVIFSPHPDDDVISMGGTLLRLVDQGHEVHVAYQTSGNIAVFDDDALRFADFAKDFKEAFHLQNERIDTLFEEVFDAMESKEPGQSDPRPVQLIKGLIRRGEAKAACRYCGIPDENAHFMDMPFYETGKVRKKPLGEEDIQLTYDLLQKIKPHQIYAAGDLSDPHGTHRVCLNAIFAALDRLKGEAWLDECYVWLYRGAWQEWDIHQIEMAVPISPIELMRKRRAIFKHQSQKDRPLFPGSDPREFWQRAEDRNQATARAYDDLGLAEYEAIEGFVRHIF
jgi:glucosamine-6-phosphate deaminase